MSVGIFSIEDKLEALDMEIAERRTARRQPGSAMHRQYEILKSVAADLRARQELPRNNALGAMERELVRLKSTVTPEGFYDPNRSRELVNIVVSKWPTISQALEQFGEETAE